MSRLRGDDVTDADRKLWRKLHWVYHGAIGKAHLIPLRIHKRLVLVYCEEMMIHVHNAGPTAISGRAIAHRVTYHFTPTKE